VRIVTGEAALPMDVRSFPSSEAALLLQTKVYEGIAKAFAADGSIKVHVNGEGLPGDRS
jgi:hypothetical protein